MGYTHYFKWHEEGAEFTQKEWDCICAEFKTVVKAADVKICFEYDKPQLPPLINDDMIWFNGPGDDGQETMVLERRAEPGALYQFCKTGQKPYDILVMALLIIVFQHTQRLRISSDGNTDDWQPAVDLVERSLKEMTVYLPGTIRDPAKPRARVK